MKTLVFERVCITADTSDLRSNQIAVPLSSPGVWPCATSYGFNRVGGIRAAITSRVIFDVHLTYQMRNWGITFFMFEDAINRFLEGRNNDDIFDPTVEALHARPRQVQELYLVLAMKIRYKQEAVAA